MSAWETELIAATTDAAVSEAFTVTGTETVVAAGLDDEITQEGVGIQFYHDGNWYDLYLNGVVQEITKRHSMITLASPGKYRVVKTATTTSVSVYLWRTETVT